PCPVGLPPVPVPVPWPPPEPEGVAAAEPPAPPPPGWPAPGPCRVVPGAGPPLTPRAGWFWPMLAPLLAEDGLLFWSCWPSAPPCPWSVPAAPWSAAWAERRKPTCPRLVAEPPAFAIV